MSGAQAAKEIVRIPEADMHEIGLQAGQIAAMASLMAYGLGSDKATSEAGEALDGLASMARTISNRAFRFIDPAEGFLEGGE